MNWTIKDTETVVTDGVNANTNQLVPTREEGAAWKNITYVANFAPNTDTAYVVNHYKVSADGMTATLAENETLFGTTDTTATATAKSYDGYTYQAAFDQNDMKTVASGTITGDGNLVLNLYYTPNTDTAYVVNHYKVSAVLFPKS